MVRFFADRMSSLEIVRRFWTCYAPTVNINNGLGIGFVFEGVNKTFNSLHERVDVLFVFKSKSLIQVSFGPERRKMINQTLSKDMAVFYNDYVLTAIFLLRL